MLCVLVVAVAAGCGGVRHARRPLPNRFVPVSLSAVDDRSFFLLGTLPCTAGRCYAIERTVDGGWSFTRTPAPAGLPKEGTTPTIRFANDRDGFIWVPFGWGDFWSTHDGGASWRRLASPDVVSITTSDRQVYAVVARCTPQQCSGYRFARGRATAVRWKESRLPFAPDGPVLSLAARGQRIWLLASPRGRVAPHDVLARSTDGGRTFVAGAGPCFADLGGRLEASSMRVVWATCATGMMAGAFRSTDGGATFVPLHTPPLVNSAELAPASDRIAVLAANGAGRPLYRTIDGGATWRPLAPVGKDDYWYEVAFTGPRVGNALVQVGARAAALWRTTDGGATWSKVS